MGFLSSLTSLGREAISYLPHRWAQASSCQSVIAPIKHVLHYPSQLSASLCDEVAGGALTLASYASCVTPFFIKNYYATHTERRAYQVLEHLDPYLRAHPGLISLIFCAKIYGGSPSYWHKAQVYFRAAISVLGLAFAWFFSRTSPPQPGYDVKRDQIAHEVIIPMVRSFDRQIVQGTLSFALQLVVNELSMQCLPHLSQTFSTANKTVTGARWALRAYLYLPLLFRTSYTLYSGYQFYKQAGQASHLPQKVELIAKELDLPTHFVGPINRVLTQFYQRAAGSVSL